jgi:hypothetical protein
MEDHPDLKKHVKGTRKKKAASKGAGAKSSAAGRRSKRASDLSGERGEDVKMGAKSLQSALMGLLKMMAGDGDINVKVDVTMRLEK